MRNYRTEKVLKGQSFFRLLEKRRDKKKRVLYVCIAIVSGRRNAQRIENTLNEKR